MINQDINIFNLRDFGGLKTKDNRVIKKGLIFRSGTLFHIGEKEKEYLNSLNLKYIIDLRSEGEANTRPDEYIPENTKYIQTSAITKRMYVTTSLNMQEAREEDKGESRLIDIYDLLPFNNEAYRFVIDLIKNNETPILFHCTAGKDRTGVLAAIILLLLGVDREDVIKDYLDSLPYLLKEYNRNNVPDSWLVKREWIEPMFNNILLEYGSNEEYFEKEYNLTKEDIEKIRNNYLVKE